MERTLPESAGAFYVFDIKKLKDRVEYLKKSLPESVRLCYAVKANTFIIGALSGIIDRFEICSPGESEICQKLGVPDGDMVISGVYKTPSVIEDMAANHRGRTYTVESMTQLRLLRELSEKYDLTLPVLLRLTNGSQFGINEGEIFDIITDRERYPKLDILGLQFFSGTQKTSIKKLKREIDRLDSLILRLESELNFKVRRLEYGPGFPTAYFSDENIDEGELFSGFSNLINCMEAKTDITLELGRSIAAGCGSYYTHIVDIKRNAGQNYILVDGGMHQLVYFGQHMAMRMPHLRLVGGAAAAEEEWNICGSLCSMNDIMAKQVPLPPVKIGDLLCFENTGAYCMTEGISLFLSRELPAVYLKNEDGTFSRVRQAVETAPFNTPTEDERK